MRYRYGRCVWVLTSALPILMMARVAVGQIPVQIVNAGPGPETTIVDVYVDGSLVADDLGFKQGTAFVNWMGIPQIFVTAVSTIVFADSQSTDASSPLVSRTLTLGELTGPGLIQMNGLVTPVVNPDGRSTALEVIVVDGYEYAASSTAEVRLMLVHSSPDLETVDVLLQIPDLPATPIFTGLGYGDVAPYITIDLDYPPPPQEGPVPIVYVVQAGTYNIIRAFEFDFRLVAGAGVVCNTLDYLSDLTLLCLVASDEPLSPGRAIAFEPDVISNPPPVPFCGDGNLDAGEECDDGNNTDGDGCSATCTLEPSCLSVVVSGTLDVTRTFQACGDLTVGPDVTIMSPGDVRFFAGQRVLVLDNFETQASTLVKAGTCGQNLCTEGPALDAACMPCVGDICSPAVAPSCCSTSWDAQCVTAVGTVCGLFCPPLG